MSYEIGVEKLVVTTSQKDLDENRIAAMELFQLEQLKATVEKYIDLYNSQDTVIPFSIDPQRFWDSGFGQMPITIPIPLKVAKAAKLGTREITITSPSMLAHVDVVRWVMSDSRYSNWFTQETLDKYAITVDNFQYLPD